MSVSRYSVIALYFNFFFFFRCRWNRALIRARGLAMGQEFKAKGVNIALSPMMNMGRVAQGGRNWEGFGADPFLAGEAAYETVLGLQAAGVQATAKHYINKLSSLRRCGICIDCLFSFMAASKNGCVRSHPPMLMTARSMKFTCNHSCVL